MVTITKVQPLTCPSCQGTNVTKIRKRDLLCHDTDCRFESDVDQLTLKKKKTKKHYNYPIGKGHNPRFDTGDYLE